MHDSEMTVYKITSKTLRKLDNTRDTPGTRAILANIRNSIGKDYSKSIDSLSYVFANLPEEYIGHGRVLNAYENSILTAIQMYALHQQAKAESVLKLDYQEKERRQNIGEALSSLRSEGSESMDRRFNAMVTSATFAELQNHLRQLVKLLKAKSNTRVDYAKLAEDLYWFLRGQKNEVSLQWARAYYQFRKKENLEGDHQNDK